MLPGIILTIFKIHPQITESSRSCVCGHVLEEASRFIAGKRYSGIHLKVFKGERLKKEA